MKKFFLNLLSSFVGTWVALLLFGAVVVMLIFAVIGKLSIGKSSMPKVEDSSVLVLNLTGSIVEQETADNIDLMELMSGNMTRPQTLRSLVMGLRDAAADKRIKALYIKCGTLNISPATANALRNAVNDFKTDSKKPIYTFGDIYTQAALYIASRADSLYINPRGTVALTGYGSTSFYKKNLFEKIGVEWQMAKVGTYKSAVEPYTSNEMSQPARQQLEVLYSFCWSQVRDGIAEGRKLKSSLLDSMVNGMTMMRNPALFVKQGLFTATSYEFEMDPRFARLLKVEKDDLNFIDCSDYNKTNSVNIQTGEGDEIAVVYATGEIAENTKGGIDCYKLMPVLFELADDDDVKGMVLRVNSPGGSVFGSDQIWQAVEYFKRKGKPVAVSMGDYAASGGYMISCGANRIFADPMTITGSIGIFGMIPNIHPLLNKIGVTTHTVATNPNSIISVPLQPLNATQMAAFQQFIDEGYDDFITKVANGRKMTKAQVDSIAQGRVWVGAEAKRLGLVDELGSLDDAIEWIKKKTNLKDPYVSYYPATEESFWMLISKMGNDALSRAIEKSLGLESSPQLIWRIKTILERKPLQVLMPEIFRIRLN